MILTLYWTGAYILQMIIYAIVVHLANTVSWTVAMMFTALYSLTFLVGTFLLPDLTGQPNSRLPAPPPKMELPPEIKKTSSERKTARRTFSFSISPVASPPTDRPKQCRGG